MDPSQPMSLADALQSGISHHQAGDLQQAESIYRQILAADPNQADALNLLGLIALQVEAFDQAIPLIERAIELQPNEAEAHGNLGNAYRETGQLNKAVARYQRALKLKPDFSDGYNNYGLALQKMDQQTQAEAQFRRAIALNPNNPKLHNNLGVTLAAQNRNNEAQQSYRETLRLDPQFVGTYNNLCLLLQDAGELDEALKCGRKAIDLAPEYADAYDNVGNVLRNLGQLDEALQSYRKGLKIAPNLNIARHLINTMLYHPATRPEALFQNCQSQIRAALPPQIKPLTHDAKTLSNHQTGPLRIGYLSADFRNHPVGHNVLPLIRHHDPNAVELFLYAEPTWRDDVTKQFEKAAHHWRPTHGLNDAQLADMIRADGIQVMIYLATGFDQNRPGIAAYRPAPVQVSFHSGVTSGLQEMDYWLTDEVLHPKEATRELFTEQLFRLPIFYNYPIPDQAPPVGPLPADRNGHITFASFNATTKLNPEVIACWSKILTALPDARLILKHHNKLGNPSLRKLILTRFKSHGIDSESVQLISAHEPLQDHLARYHEADIALDPFPFTGATTTFQALWMGVPVITLLGERFVGRMAGDIICHAGLKTPLTTDNQEGYVERALTLAGKREELREMRATMRQRLMDSPLCDGPGYARNLEAAYRTMWQAAAKPE
ncbi:MAG: tetratricopeptide repeat protein [Magnetococcales bacterium]|nr:tetratricopeptide repeat protein [Magnetococcales bacterium]